MPFWKKSIFVNAIKGRAKLENRTKEDLIKEYVKLTDLEVKEILSSIA